MDVSESAGGFHTEQREKLLLYHAQRERESASLIKIPTGCI
jgi:hypothetical protein